MGLFRLLFWLAIFAVLIWLGATVELGRKTFFEHVRAVWATDEAREMVEGVKETADPVSKRVRRGAEAGWEAATTDGGALDAAP